MKHAREDYNLIQNGRKFSDESRIPEDEPVFLVRVQDKLSAMVVEFWATQAEIQGADMKIVIKAKEQALNMAKWQLNVKSKLPDLSK